MPKHTLGLMLTVLFLGLVFVLPVQFERARTPVPTDSQAAQSPAEIDPTLIRMEPCWFDVPSDWPTAECGTLHVPEDHLQPGPRMIQLPFVVFRSSDPRRGAVPVVVAGGGGPGGPLGIGRNAERLIDESLWYSYANMSVYGGRDLVLIDNRGVGSSIPRLECPEVEDAFLNLIQTGATDSEEVTALRDGFSTCRQRLTQCMDRLLFARENVLDIGSR